MQVNSVAKNFLKTGAVIATVAVPAVYMTKFHVDMYPKENKTGRSTIFNKMLGFWAGFSAGCLAIHSSLKIKIKDGANNLKAGNILLRSLILIAGASMPYIGVETSKIINKKIYPAQDNNKSAANLFNSPMNKLR